MKFLAFLDPLITRWMAKNGIRFLRYSIALIFIWFGALKFFPGVSPAEALATDTIALLTFDLIPKTVTLPLLAGFEVLIGLLILTDRFLRLTILLLLVQMVGTMSPIVLFPDLVFNSFPFVLTIEGQYIFKNLIVISAAITVGATARGGRLDPEPSGI
jgi:uncharacterized membrane protein YkgB